MLAREARLLHKMLDKLLLFGISVFTLTLSLVAQRTNAQTTATRSKAPESASAGCTQPKAAAGHRRVVHRQRFLRRPRLGASQVRDVAARSTGRAIHQRGRPVVRAFPPVLLSGAIRLRGQWTHRSHTTETWPQGRSQADCGGDGIYRTNTSKRPVLRKRGPGESAQAAFRGRRPSAKHRARAGSPSKKTPHAEMSRKLLPSETGNWLFSTSNCGKTLYPCARSMQTHQAWRCSLETG